MTATAAKIQPLMPATSTGSQSPDSQNNDLQGVFLSYVHTRKHLLTVFLVNGVKLEGMVSDFDQDCFTLTRNGHTQLVYKHSVSTIMPLDDISVDEISGGGARPLSPAR